jgi:hypothetical protein
LVPAATVKKSYRKENGRVVTLFPNGTNNYAFEGIAGRSPALLFRVIVVMPDGLQGGPCFIGAMVWQGGQETGSVVQGASPFVRGA